MITPSFTYPATLTALFAIGIAFAFVVADRHSPSSRMFSLSLAAIGVGITGNFLLVHNTTADVPVSILRLVGIPTVVAMLAAAEWVLRVRRTIPAGGLRTQFGDTQLRLAQLAAVLYGAASLIWPQWRIDYFYGNRESSLRIDEAITWLFAAPFFIYCLLLVGGLLVTLNRRPDAGERRRILATVLGIPLMASGLSLSTEVSFYTTTCGLIAVLIGGVQYHVLQGKRAQFMTRFLAPQVAELVNKRGLLATMQERTLPITVVACDLRGFTAYAESHIASEVIALLNRYYEHCGRLAEQYGATIKDYAGDGVLMLVGAPVGHDNNASLALQLGDGLANQIGTMLKSENLPLGIGVGIASGPVSVGVVGTQRLEYAAVGAAVNLAARLCDKAKDDEILVDTATYQLAPESIKKRLKGELTLTLKGITNSVSVRRLTGTS